MRQTDTAVQPNACWLLPINNNLSMIFLTRDTVSGLIVFFLNINKTFAK